MKKGGQQLSTLETVAVPATLIVTEKLTKGKKKVEQKKGGSPKTKKTVKSTKKQIKTEKPTKTVMEKKAFFGLF